METLSPSSSTLSAHQEGSAAYDEFSVQQGLLFSESLKDLKNLRSQLYSAAEYFELSYTNDDHKQVVVNTLKDYAVKALVNTVDHLGSVSYKVDDLLNEKVDEVSASEIRVSCIEQRVQACQDYIDHQGLSQQTLLISTPKYHKRYILPVGVSMPESGRQATAVCQEIDVLEENYESEQFQAAVRSTIRYKTPPVSKKMRSPSPSPRARSSSPSHRKVNYSLPSNHSGNLLSTEKRRSVSPLPISNPFARSGSLSSRATVRNAPSTRRYPSEPKKSASVRLHAERNDSREFEEKSSKSRGFLKSLLSRRKSRNDEMLYSYLDEY
ncbi:LOW QUALITY PROTEIN: protein ABIL2-like [Dioscorea cayenensis subsp. rotundata]|uniref:LOW QUALITY PROTEIN: protein ABIL2-like n=1 Tax=Dioscorea cayennensis subsp. rotundata TaxID=55577 RepID=A0AB40B1M9_DIOCR|nr:LOW QUALITY PROTEIN: protein ABIL2-like [Dioscorea cayenensis subsp. rotundata]